jgi:hypothetical protein
LGSIVSYQEQEGCRWGYRGKHHNSTTQQRQYDLSQALTLNGTQILSSAGGAGVGGVSAILVLLAALSLLLRLQDEPCLLLMSSGQLQRSGCLLLLCLLVLLMLVLLLKALLHAAAGCRGKEWGLCMLVSAVVVCIAVVWTLHRTVWLLDLDSTHLDTLLPSHGRCFGPMCCMADCIVLLSYCTVCPKAGTERADTLENVQNTVA